MDYYLSPGKIILSIRTFLFLCSVGTAILAFKNINISHDYFVPVCWLIIAIGWIFPIAQLLYVWLLKRPALTVNKDFIIDHLREKKYYWVDVKEAVADNNYLTFDLYEPGKYFDKPTNRFDRWMHKIFSKSLKAKPSFYFDIYLLDVERDEFLEILNNFSIAAESKS